MNDRQLCMWEAYIQQVGGLMGLVSWDIRLDRNWATLGTWASVVVSDKQDTASVRLAWPEFFSQSPEDQRQAVVHELVHCLTARFHQTAERFLEGNDVGLREITVAAEIATENLARAIAPFMPLPPAVEEADR